MPNVDRGAKYVTMNLPPRVSNGDIVRWQDLLRNAADDETFLLSGDDLEELSALVFQLLDDLEELSALGFQLLDDLLATRRELSELRGVVREACAVLGLENTPDCLVDFAREFTTDDIGRFDSAIRALVEAAQEDSNA